MNALNEIEILLVEDNPGDIDLTLIAFGESRLKNKINVVTDGEQALDYIYGRAPFEERQIPDIILLDINLPKKSGLEVLEILKQDNQYRRIPVIMLTTSENEKDILSAYDKHVNAYLSKPVDFTDFISIIKKIEDFWLTLVKLP